MPECQKIKKGGLDQYGLECFGSLIFATVRKNVEMKGLNESCNAELDGACDGLVMRKWRHRLGEDVNMEIDGTLAKV